MKIHRFYIDNFDISQKDIVLYSKDNLDLWHQWFNVLKFEIGENIILFSNYTDDYVFEIIDYNKKSCQLKFLYLNSVHDNINNITDMSFMYKLHLHLPIIKKDNLYLILEKSTEMGILNFYPNISDRTEKRNIESFNRDIDKNRLYIIVKEAVEQSCQSVLPQIHLPQKMFITIDNLIKDKNNIILVADFNGINIRNYIKNISEYCKYNNMPDLNIHIFIGPEGGWTDIESDKFKEYKDNYQNNFFIISLNNSVLRAETACIYMISNLI